MAVGHNTGAVRENPGMPRERGKRRERPPEKKKIGFFHDKTAGAVDMPMLVITLVLLVLGITMMFSASHALSYRDNGGDSYQYATRQLFFAGAGLIAMFFLSLVDYRIFIREWHPKLFGKVRTITLSHVALVVSLGLTALVIPFGIRNIADGPKRWLPIPGGSFQPSDVLKFGLIIWLAWYVSKNYQKMRHFVTGLLKPGLVLGVIVAIIFAGLVAAFFAYLIGLPVLRLKSDYLAIATLGFAEILRAIFQWQTLGKVTNGANILKGYPTFADFNITNASGKVLFRLSAVVPILLAGICIFLIVLLINSSYGRAFKAIRDDEIAAEAMGVNLAKHKSLSFVISSFFAGVSGALFAMFATTVQAKVFTSAMTYEILLIVVIGGIGSVSGSCIASFLYIACSEWWLRFLDNEAYIGAFKVPLLRNGFRMVVFSIIIMIVVLFFRKGIMGERELPDLFRKRPKKAKKNVVEEGKADE